MKVRLSIIFALQVSLTSFAQKIQTPAEFLGYQLGEQFTPHYRVVDYFRYIATASKNVRLQEYGKTNESRPLLLAFIASDENISRLEDIRKNNLRLAGVLPGNPPKPANPVIVWLSYNVHGNEAVSTEASMQMLFALVDPSETRTKEWLKNTVVIIDPCINPDGRERYVNFYNPVRNAIADPSPFSREHSEPWPGGRPNHYYFDLNRDWAWQSQIETKARLAVYNQWLPEVHSDYHEQGINEPYYFAPAAEPFHDVITSWQREAQQIIGRNNAKYFDKNGWMYFTRERFDLLYPSYGDTYPLYSGSIGMTFEQGGSGRAGIAVITGNGDTLTLRKRIDHHVTTGIATIESASVNAAKLLKGFADFYSSSKNDPQGEYKTYVIKGDNPEKLKTLASLLKNNGIEVGYGAAKGGLGFNYFTGNSEPFSVGPADMVVTAFQPRSALARVLLEPKTHVSDSVTYDITAWSLPYAFGLNAWASKETIRPLASEPPAQTTTAGKIADPVAFIAGWNAVADVKFLAALLKKSIKVRYTEVPVEIGGRKFNPGSLIIARTGNEALGERFTQVVTEIGASSGIVLTAVSTGFADKGPDLGSDKIRYLQRPVIAVLGGEESSPASLGEIWQFFEQQIVYPVSIVNFRDFNRVNFDKINVLIVPEGSFSNLLSERLSGWIRNGGRLIALGTSVGLFADQKGYRLKSSEPSKEKEASAKDPYSTIKAYADRERESTKSSIPGAIFKVDLDNTHPLAFGFPPYYFALKQDDSMYRFLDGGWNVGILKKDSYVTGFTGIDAKRKLADGLLFGVEEIGSGTVVYLDDDPLFRGFWENGKLLFSNAVFMVGN